MTPARALEVHITAPDMEQAATLARALIEERLAACVNIVPGVRSLYRWQGKLCDDTEVLCLVKTGPARLGALMERVRSLHPYENPEILAFEAVDGSPAYLDWLAVSTEPG